MTAAGDGDADPDSAAREEVKDEEAQRRIEALTALIRGELLDLEKPAGQRRCGDRYMGPAEDVSQVFLADSHRASYRIEHVDYCYANGSGDGAECSATDPDKTAAFGARLAAIVRQCIGAEGDETSPRVGLMRITTMLLSQAGQALVGAACRGPQLALSGGDRIIRYELEKVTNGQEGWLVQVIFVA